MSFSKGIVLFLICFIICINSKAQNDSISITQKPISYDSVHYPKRATVLATIFPSAGHIYNHSKRLPHHKSHLWWKLPIIYGGMGTMGYLIISNHQQFKAFKQERISRLDPLYNPSSGNYAVYANFQLQQIQEQYRRWRDLSIIGALGVYALQIIDATVEGHLLHFDTSNDLTISVLPSANWNRIESKSFFGATCIITF